MNKTVNSAAAKASPIRFSALRRTGSARWRLRSSGPRIPTWKAPLRNERIGIKTFAGARTLAGGGCGHHFRHDAARQDAYDAAGGVFRRRADGGRRQCDQHSRGRQMSASSRYRPASAKPFVEKECRIPWPARLPFTSTMKTSTLPGASITPPTCGSSSAGARKWLRERGFTHLGFANSTGIVFAVRSLQVDDLAPALIDDLI